MQHLCQVFGVHRSSYRAWRDRDRRPCETEQKLLDQVVEAHTVSNGSAGARSIAKMGSSTFHVDLASSSMRPTGLPIR